MEALPKTDDQRMRIALVEAGRVTQDIVDGMRREMRDVQNDPDAVFFYAFVQARATVY